MDRKKPDPIKELLHKANQTATGSPTICSCGTLEQAVLQCDEILTGTGQFHDRDCPVWVAYVAAAMFAHAADVLQKRGLTPMGIQKIFIRGGLAANSWGMGFNGSVAHFDTTKKINPKKGTS